MLKVTAKALEGSIKKWEGIANGTAIDQGMQNCNLCQRYAIPLDCRYLDGCPVTNRTGLESCRNTPYHLWDTHHEEEHEEEYYDSEDGQKVLCPICKELAEKEVAFLKSLREV